jgi:hypothetical protein
LFFSWRVSVAYVSPNYKSKKALKEAVAAGKPVTVFSPGPFPCSTDGRVSIEGPHYPEPHRFYATVHVENGKVVKVLG